MALNLKQTAPHTVLPKLQQHMGYGCKRLKWLKDTCWLNTNSVHAWRVTNDCPVFVCMWLRVWCSFSMVSCMIWQGLVGALALLHPVLEHLGQVVEAECHHLHPEVWSVHSFGRAALLTGSWVGGPSRIYQPWLCLPHTWQGMWESASPLLLFRPGQWIKSYSLSFSNQEANVPQAPWKSGGGMTSMGGGGGMTSMGEETWLACECIRMCTSCGCECVHVCMCVWVYITTSCGCVCVRMRMCEYLCMWVHVVSKCEYIMTWVVGVKVFSICVCACGCMCVCMCECMCACGRIFFNL